MVRLSIARDVRTALKSPETVVLMAPATVLRKDRFPKIFGAKLKRLALELAKKAKPGDSAGTLTGDAKPARLMLCVLPNEVSRYNCAARPDAIQKTLSSAGVSDDKRVSVILVLDDPVHGLPSLNAIGRVFPKFSRKSEKQGSARIQIAAVDRKGEGIKIEARDHSIMEMARDSAEWVDTPPTDLNPETFAKEAKAALSELKQVTVKEIVGDALLKAKLNGIHSVGRAAVKAPRMLVASYKPRSGSDLHVALVGKGITFDTGGLHIKGRGMMETMKCDMGGAAAVLGAFRALAAQEVPHRVTLLMCLAENAVGPASYKPDDILAMHSGKTVEINNTDAEGRLLLADGVSYAARELDAEYVFDAATLTGAQLIATGQNHAAVVSNDAELEALVVETGRASGDLVHPLPFAPEFYNQEFKSPVADMRNSVKNRANAQTSCAAQFVWSHLDGSGVKWCHVDLAGPSFRNDRGTGFGVALLAETVRQLG